MKWTKRPFFSQNKFGKRFSRIINEIPNLEGVVFLLRILKKCPSIVYVP